MSGGIDKLVLTCASISDLFLQLARKQGVQKWHYNHVIDLRQTDHNLPICIARACVTVVTSLRWWT